MFNSNIYIIYLELLKLMNLYPKMPPEIRSRGGVEIGETDGRKTSMSLLCNLVLDKSITYICGDKMLYFEAQIMYQNAGTMNDDKLASINLISNMGLWLSGKEILDNFGNQKKIKFPVEIENGTINLIEILEDASLMQRNENGINIYSMRIKIEVELNRF